MKKLKISQLAPAFRYLQTLALKLMSKAVDLLIESINSGSLEKQDRGSRIEERGLGIRDQGSGIREKIKK